MRKTKWKRCLGALRHWALREMTTMKKGRKSAKIKILGLLTVIRRHSTPTKNNYQTIGRVFLVETNKLKQKHYWEKQFDFKKIAI